MAIYRRVLVNAVFLLLVSTYVVANDDDDADAITVETIEEVEYESPQIDPKNVYLAEHFDDEAAFKKKWVKSEAKKQGVDENIAKYDGKWEIQTPAIRILKNDYGLVLTTEAKHAAISALLDRPFEFKEKPLVVQYEVTMQDGQNCGGAYIKLLSRGANTRADLRQFTDQTPYTIMFGPDKCGNDNKLHFIFRHRNPKNGTVEEKHAKKPTQRLEDIYKDKEPHLYTLIVRPDNTFSILVDSKEANSGSLLEDFTPPVNPPEMVDDPEDRKPADWDEREKIVDPTATKPADWDDTAPAQIVDPNAVKPEGWLDDEPEMVPDPDSKKPEDWDEEMDGDWEPPLVDNPSCSAAAGCGDWKPPLIPNPNYKGVWRAPLIPNPNYKGKWSPRRIPNPHFFKDDHPFRMTPIHAVGFELWSMSPQLLFDNLIITDDPKVAEQWAKQSYALKRAKLNSDSQTLWGRVLKATQYRPGWWALYAFYCSIPVIAYVTYLLRRAKEESVVERALKYAGENPWVYALVIVGSFVTVGLVAYMCCGPPTDTDAYVKKTDAVVYEDSKLADEFLEELLDLGEDEKISDEEKEGDKAERTGDEEEKKGEGKETEGDGETEESEKPRKADLEGPEEIDSTETTPLVDNEGAGDGPRKRKPRKE